MKRKFKITEIRTKSGELAHDREGIAEAFGEFYKELYRSRQERQQSLEQHSDRELEPFCMSELHSALKQLKRGKA